MLDKLNATRNSIQFDLNKILLTIVSFDFVLLSTISIHLLNIDYFLRLFYDAKNAISKFQGVKSS
jgi:hypothetical protein